MTPEPFGSGLLGVPVAVGQVGLVVPDRSSNNLRTLDSRRREPRALVGSTMGCFPAPDAQKVRVGRFVHAHTLALF